MHSQCCASRCPVIIPLTPSTALGCQYVEGKNRVLVNSQRPLIQTSGRPAERAPTFLN